MPTASVALRGSHVVGVASRGEEKLSQPKLDDEPEAYPYLCRDQQFSVQLNLCHIQTVC
ncbi:hypothetical protein [Nostoc sp.]